MKLIVRLLRKLNVLRFLNLKVSVVKWKSKFIIPINGGLGFNNIFESEAWMIYLLSLFDDLEEALFIDVGANIGQTLLKVKAIKPNIDYIGFEPNPACLYYLNELIRVNNFQNVNIIPVGLAIKTGLNKLNFYNEDLDDGSASMIENFRPTNKVFKEENIPVFDYNELSKSVNLEGVSILKIDVEGAEYEVLTTLFRVIEQNKPIILIEILPVYSLEHSERLEKQVAIEKMLKDLTYFTLQVFPEKDKILLKQISEIGIHSDIDHCDYICIPEEKLQDFKIRALQSQNIIVQD